MCVLSVTLVDGGLIMKFESTVTFSLILGIAAILSPIFTSIIDNRYRLKMKQMEIDNQNYERNNLRSIEFLEDYLSQLLYLNALNAPTSFESIRKYQNSRAHALPYLPPSLYEKALHVNPSKDTAGTVFIIVDGVREEIHRLKTETKPSKSKWYKHLLDRVCDRCNQPQ